LTRPVLEEIEVRRCRVHDADEAYHALAAIRTDKVQVEGVEAFLSNEDNVLLIARRGLESVGYLTAYFLDRPDDRRPMACLYDVGVPTEHRGLGVGSRLVESMKELCRERGALKMWLVTEASNEPAIALYRSTGAVAANEEGDLLLIYRFFDVDGAPSL